MEPAFTSARALASRTVHVKIHPTARTLSERREVLRVLERFGEVGMFRSLKYSLRTPVPNAFLSIFNTETAATEAINASPIRYRLIIEASKPSPPISAFPGHPAPTPSPPPSASATAERENGSDNGNREGNAEKPVEEERVFELHISSSNFNHDIYVKSPVTNPLYGPWRPVKPVNSYVAAALERVVPQGVAARGLRDWETGGVRGRSGGVEGLDGEGGFGRMGDSGLGGGGGGFTVEQRVLQRERRRRREREVPRVMGGLRKLREEWKGRQKEKEGMDGVD